MPKREIAVCLIMLILAGIPGLPTVLATDPSTSDLSGTDSSDYDSITTATITSSSADSYMSSKSADTNYGTLTTMDVGYSPSAKIRRAIVKFDLTSIPAIAWVDSANVSLYVASFSQSFTIG
ncbi:MAG: DNRLRE domain-containing protein, partial [Thermoproteota archaeon]